MLTLAQALLETVGKAAFFHNLIHPLAADCTLFKMPAAPPAQKYTAGGVEQMLYFVIFKVSHRCSFLQTVKLPDDLAQMLQGTAFVDV